MTFISSISKWLDRATNAGVRADLRVKDKVPQYLDPGSVVRQVFIVLWCYLADLEHTGPKLNITLLHNLSLDITTYVIDNYEECIASMMIQEQSICSAQLFEMWILRGQPQRLHTQIVGKLENNLNKLLKKHTVHVLHQTTVPTSDH